MPKLQPRLVLQPVASHLLEGVNLSVHCSGKNVVCVPFLPLNEIKPGIDFVDHLEPGHFIPRLAEGKAVVALGCLLLERLVRIEEIHDEVAQLGILRDESGERVIALRIGWRRSHFVFGELVIGLGEIVVRQVYPAFAPKQKPEGIRAANPKGF